MLGLSLFILAADTLACFSDYYGDFYFPAGQQVEIAVRVEPTEPGVVDSAIIWHPGTGTDSLVITVMSESTQTRPGTVLHTDTVALSGRNWFGFPLPAPVPLCGGQDLWISARYLNPGSAQAFGVDSGPAIHSKGCFTTRNSGISWDEMWRYGIDTDFNWCLGLLFHPETDAKDVAAEEVVLDPPYTYKGFPMVPRVYFQNYSDTIIETPVRALIYDSTWNQVYSDDTVIRLYPYSYYLDGDTISFAPATLPEGLYHIIGTIGYPGDSFHHNDTVQAVSAVVSYRQDFESDLEDQDWWITGQGWRPYTGYQSWAHWQGLPFGWQCYMNDNGGRHSGAMASEPLVLSPGAQLFFYTSVDFAPESTGKRLIVFMRGNQRDTVDISDFVEKQWTLLYYSVPISAVETVRVAFSYSSADEWYIDEMALTLVDTILATPENTRNPVQDIVFPSVVKGILPVKTSRACQLELFDPIGRLAARWELPGPGKYNLNVARLVPGVYFLRENPQSKTTRIEVIR